MELIYTTAQFALWLSIEILTVIGAYCVGGRTLACIVAATRIAMIVNQYKALKRGVNHV